MSTVAAKTEEMQAQACRHHWVIDAPEGALSLGRCKICGEQKEFRNSAGDSMWEPEGSQGSASWGRQSRGLPGGPVDDGF